MKITVKSHTWWSNSLPKKPCSWDLIRSWATEEVTRLLRHPTVRCFVHNNTRSNAM